MTTEMVAWVSLGELPMSEMLPEQQPECLSCKAGFGQLTDNSGLLS